MAAPDTDPAHDQDSWMQQECVDFFYITSWIHLFVFLLVLLAFLQELGINLAKGDCGEQPHSRSRQYYFRNLMCLAGLEAGYMYKRGSGTMG
jgi:hypothetical protein